MDPSLLVAVVSVATAAVTTSGGVAVAILTNRKEAENAADDTLEKAQQERLTLKDEQIAALEIQKRNRDERIARLETDNDRLRRENERLREARNAGP